MATPVVSPEPSQAAARHEPIAIVGIGLRFPGGNETLDGFDEFLRAGRTGIRPPPADRWDSDVFMTEDPQARGKIRAAGGGFLDSIDQFDAPFFGISPLEADYIDPQQRILLETTWEALENANINPATLRHSNGGVYIGASDIDYALELESLPYEDLDGHLAAGVTLFPLSGRVSYVLGWRGPSLTTDTACASSLTALHLAAEGLRSGQCDVAVAGAVAAIHHPLISIMFTHGKMLAPDGKCKTFDESADGYVRAEGCGVLVLKRWSDARRDGDNVLALVRGTAIGQNGESAGLTVPNGTAQAIVMRTALRAAGLEPGDIQYVEAHGTGTALGDPIEMGAIADVFSVSRTKHDPLMVASVKTNLGHMEPVAGIGGIVKTVLQMREGVIYPHLNFVSPSPRIPWDDIPVAIPTECRPWTARTRRAAVNSFGFAGGIACAVLEEAPIEAEPVRTRDAGPFVFTVSAKSKRSLRMQVERYRQYLAGHPDSDVADICYTGGAGRSHFPLRLAAVVRDRAELATQLDKQLARLDSDRPADGRGDIRKVAFLFTGQGSQYPGMGRVLYQRHPVFRQHVDECDRLFAQPLGRSIKDLMFSDAADGAAAEELGRTGYAQPALFTLEYALARLWQSWGVRPTILIGHSIGEVAAATVAGLFSLADAVTLVAARARLMQSVRTPGGMAAVSASADEVEPLLADYPDLALAAVNSPKQCVVSGGLESLAAVTAELADRGLRVKQLAVSHAFHSPLMTEVFDQFRAAIAGVGFHEPTVTMVSNLTGKVAKVADLSDPEYWVRHIGEPVAFEAGMRTIERRGKHAFIEIGPSRALTAPAKQCVVGGDHRWLASLSPTDQDDVTICDAVAQVYTCGLPISWTGFYAGRERRRLVLPNYAFDRKRHWLPATLKRHRLGDNTVRGDAVHPLLGVDVTTAEQTAGGIREFSAKLSAGNPGYLADHVVAGRVVFPGTGYLEVLLALQDAVYGDTRRPIQDVLIHEPLFLSAEEETEVRTRLRTADDGGTVEILSRAAGADGVIERSHTTARFAAHPETTDALTGAGKALLALAAGAGEPHDVRYADDIYTAYSDAGLDYGTTFRRMRSAARHGAGFAVGELDGVAVGAIEQISPFIVDAAAHVYAAIAEEGDSYLPIGYRWFRAFKKPKAETLRVLMRIDPDPAPGVDLSLDYVVFEDDQPVFELRGLGMKRIVGGAGTARRSLIHEPRWLKRSLLDRSVEEVRRVLVVHHDEAQHARLAGQGARPGVELLFAADIGAATAAVRDARITDLCWFWRSDDRAAEIDVDRLRSESELNYRDLLGLLSGLRDADFGRDQRLWLITEGAQWLPGDEGRAGAAASLWGFGHTLLNEFPSYQATMVDLSADEADYSSLLDDVQARSAGEYQIAYRGGLRHVKRLLPLAPAVKPGREPNFELSIEEYGQFSGIKVIAMQDTAPEGDEVQVEVHAAGLNFKDVLNALGLLKEYGEQPLGFEAAGTVVAVGPQARHRIGDPVIVNYLGCFRRRMIVPSALAVAKPPNVDFNQAAGLAAVYVTAYYALHTLAGMKAGDKVLIHAAAGGVGQAAVQLAKAAGAEVFATASPHKWALLREQGVEHVMSSRNLDFADEILRLTGGAGVDIVLNSLNKDYIPAGMRCLGRDGRFVEMGKVGAWTPEQVREARPDVAYHNFDLSELPWDEAIRTTGEIMRLVLARVAAGELAPVKTTVYSLDEIDEAFGVLSRGANIGKLVLDFSGHLRPAGPESVIDADHTYLITGGLGGLGLVTADKLVDRGARHLALVSRSGDPAPEVAQLAARLGDRAEVTIVRADIADPADVARFMAQLAESPHPLGGIFHAAGTLHDGPVTSQTWETIDEVFRTKVYGTWLLHEAARSLPELGFFVGYSSAAPIVGTPGQANYAAANAYLDNLCLWRAAAGLPALSINWGPWGEVGMSARNSAVLFKRWEDEGIKLTTPTVGMRGLKSLLDRPIAQATVGECDWDRFTGGKPIVNALYQRLLGFGGAGQARTVDLEALLGSSKPERIAIIDEFVRTRVAAVLHFDGPDAVDSTTEFVRLGLDSLVAVELKNALEAAFRVALPASVALEHPSAELLAEFLEGQLVPVPVG